MTANRSSPRSRFGAVVLTVATTIARSARAEPVTDMREHGPPRAVDAAPVKAEQGGDVGPDAAANEGSSEGAARAPKQDADAMKPAREDDPPRDEVKLRDGRRVRGRVVQKQPGRWVVIASEDGVRRTLAWDLVEEVAVVPAAHEANAPDAVRSAWQARTGAGLIYELRVAITGIVLPTRTFGVTGDCATGSGLAPASMYGQFATDSGRAAGGGIGGRLGYMYMSHIEPEGSSAWWALRAGAGLDLQILHSQIPVGIKPVDGELCSRVARMRHEVEMKSSSLLLAHVPLTFGTQLGLGSFDEGMVWRGVVIGAAWAPSYVQMWPWVGDASSHFNPLGLELTFDLATLRAATSGKRAPEAQFRVSLFLAPSLDVTQPTIGMLGFGPAWY